MLEAPSSKPKGGKALDYRSIGACSRWIRENVGSKTVDGFGEAYGAWGACVFGGEAAGAACACLTWFEDVAPLGGWGVAGVEQRH